MADDTKPDPSVDNDTEPRNTALRLLMLPRDTNQYGTIFGGVILSAVDQAAFIEARRHGLHRWVTAAVDRVEFIAPVQVGDVVSFLTRTMRRGRSSVQVEVRVEAERFLTGELVKVTEAALTMVAVDSTGRSIPFESPPSVAMPGFSTPTTESADGRSTSRGGGQGG